MKKLEIILTVLLFVTGYTADAQMEHKYNSNQSQKQGTMTQKNSRMMQGMMEKGMCSKCGQMMSQNMPMKKYGMMVNHLPNMQQQLSLSDEQVERLLDLQAEFKKQQVDYQTELRKKQMKLKSLLVNNASTSQVKSQMEACSETKINMKVAAYETVGKMKAILNNDQKEQLKNNMMQDGEIMQGMMEKGMCSKCGQMMNQNMPMKKYGMMVNHLPKMQQQLSLSDEQVETLLDLQAEFKKQQIDYQTELRKKQMKLKSLLINNTSASQVKSQMESCSETKINMKVAAYETAGKMKAILNSDQKEQLKNIMMQNGEMMHGRMIKQGQNGMMQKHGDMMQNKNNQ